MTGNGHDGIEVHYSVYLDVFGNKIAENFEAGIDLEQSILTTIGSTVIGAGQRDRR